ncbi:MAG: alpha-L-arabinofuranosidase [Verrucomicrobia bacterium]|nr:alpha-L-arabinofuranosidase [Verrucomicrobiota bacterium]
MKWSQPFRVFRVFRGDSKSGFRLNPLLRRAQLGLLLFCSAAAWAADVSITVQADRPGAKINPAMWGVFFEDINFGADGGLYPELVKNRGFEFPDGLMGWSQVRGADAAGSIEIRTNDPALPASPHYLRLKADKPGSGFGMVNDGFRGMAVRAGERYTFSAHLRSTDGTALPVTVELLGSDGKAMTQARIASAPSKWGKDHTTLTAPASDPKARLQIRLEQPGTLELDAVSLFPEKTFKNRANGLRADLAQWLADLKPGFMRFPGGCIVEGRHLPLRYQWKTTIGPVEERRLLINRWNDEFKHRPAPDYFQSFGLGFFEFFQLCEDIGAAPLPILNCGMACQFNSGELVPLEELDPFIKDALDLIEFANGSTNFAWGAKRAAMGHPAPFRMKVLGVGNEQWGPQYLERYTKFAGILKARHPEIQLVSSAGPDPGDDRFRFLWEQLRALKADIVDEHCYALPAWFLDNSARYDRYPRTGPKVFMGEYAAQSVKTVSPSNRNNWECALAEAAYMIGLERNADVVVMASYAPLSAHADAWQWTPNLIWFDNLRSYATPSYYVQQAFSVNRGDVLLPTRVMRAPIAGNRQPRFYASAVRDAGTGEIIIKAVNATAEPQGAAIRLNGVPQVGAEGKAVVLASANLADENSFNEPKKVAPVEEKISGIAPAFRHVFKPHSLTVLRLSAPTSGR